MTAARIGVLDIGSNTVLMLVLEAGDRIVCEASHITRLGQGVFETGRLAPEAAARTRLAVADLCERARAAGARRVVAVGTEALRRARDGARFLAELVGPDEVRLLSGEEEAACSIEAARRVPGTRPGALVLIDPGGGSTELAWETRAGEVSGVSLPLGSVRLTEAWLPRHPVPAADLRRARAAVQAGAAALDAHDVPRRPARVVAVAGTATTLAALDLALEPYDAERVEGHFVSRGTLGDWLSRLAQLDVAARCRLPGLEPGRADVIVAGLLIVDVLLSRLDATGFHASGRGVRHGVALRLLAGDSAFC